MLNSIFPWFRHDQTTNCYSIGTSWPSLDPSFSIYVIPISCPFFSYRDFIRGLKDGETSKNST